MHRLFPLAIILLPLVLAAASVGAREPGQPASPAPQARDAGAAVPMGPRLPGPRESPERWRRDHPSSAMAPRQPHVDAATARQDPRSISDAIRRVQRSTRGQILGVEQVPFEGRNITRVKYMDDRGRVRYMDAPPEGAVRPAPRRADNGEP